MPKKINKIPPESGGIISHSNRRMSVLMAGHAVNIHDNVLVCVGMAIGTRS